MPRITVNSSSTKIRGSVSGSVVSEDTTLLDNEQSLQQQSPVNPEEGLRDTGSSTSITVTQDEGLVGNVNNDQDNLRANPSDGASDNNGTALTEGTSPGEPRDGTDEEDLRPVVVDGDIRKLYTLRGAVTSIILNSDGSYNNEVYDILATLNSDDILPHVSVTDLNVDGDYRMVVTNAVKDGDSIKIWYSEQNGITGNSNLYYVTIYPDGSYTRQQHNIDDGFYKVGSDGYLWAWDNNAKQYVSTGSQFVGSAYHIEVYTANGGQLMRSGSECDVFAEVWNNNMDMTSRVPSSAFSWQRSSGHQREDYIWNNNHEGVGNTIHLTVYEVMKSCTIYCLVPVSVLENLNI